MLIESPDIVLTAKSNILGPTVDIIDKKATELFV